MNATGHEQVAKTVGIPIIEDAIGKDNRGINAFYLGNWLTDVSQTIDPVAYWKASKRGKEVVEKGLKKAVDFIIEQATAALFLPLPGSKPMEKEFRRISKSLMREKIDDATSHLKKCIDFLIKIQTDERDPRLAEFFRNTFLLIGYFKFVHPNHPKQKPRMDFEYFMKVFGRPTDTHGARGNNPAFDRSGAFTQYYPYYHFDRPEILPWNPPTFSPNNPPIYAPGKQVFGTTFRIAKGKKRGTRSPRRKEKLQPDLYSYIRDNIEMTAGLLAEVNLELKLHFKQKIKDNNPKLNLTLAKFGHAIHQVEDFFSHSNWIELVGKRLGPEYLSKVMYRIESIEFLDIAYSKYLKRLKRYYTKPLKNWDDHEKEDYVVTGFFDFKDTLISLLHLSETFWGGNVPDPLAAGHNLYEAAKKRVKEPNLAVQEVKNTLKWTLDFITEPEKELKNPENKVAQKLKDEFEPIINDLRTPYITKRVANAVINEITYLNRAPEAIKDAFRIIILNGVCVSRRLQGIYKIGKKVVSLYEIIKSIVEFFRSPIKWFIDFLTGFLKKQVIDAIKFYVKELFYWVLGSERIGCHSLISKDSKYEPLYDEQMKCTMAVHYYIVDTMFRTSKEDQNYVDWLELLEHFLRNPSAPVGSLYQEIKEYYPVPVGHIVKKWEQLKAKKLVYSIYDQYKKTAFKGMKFTWRTIADANFGTYGYLDEQAQNIINQVLKDSSWGFPVKKPNWAMKEGLFLWIPNQRSKNKFTYHIKKTNEPLWFKEVVEKGWEVFKPRYDERTKACFSPAHSHTPKMINEHQLKEIIIRGKRLRRTARELYQPPPNRK